MEQPGKWNRWIYLKFNEKYENGTYYKKNWNNVKKIVMKWKMNFETYEISLFSHNFLFADDKA